MGHNQTCPNCNTGLRVAGLYQTSFGNDRGGAARPKVMCNTCQATFEARESEFMVSTGAWVTNNNRRAGETS